MTAGVLVPTIEDVQLLDQKVSAADAALRGDIEAALREINLRFGQLESRVDDDVDDEARARLAALESHPPGDTYDDAELRAELAALKARPDDDEDDEARARIAALEARPTGTGNGAILPFRTFASFPGANDTERFKALLDWEAARPATGSQPEIWFEGRVHNLPYQLSTRPRRWNGTATRAGEFGTGTVINYTGPAGTSLFVLTKNAGYSYPANGVSRDGNYRGIQWSSGNDRDFLPPAPAGYDANFVQWYWQFPDCGWVGWRRITNGWGTGLDFPGFLHHQGAKVTPFTLGGSECKIGLSGGFMDSAQPDWLVSDLPFFDWSLSKSVLGSVMVSARLKSYQMRITYGHNSRCIGTEFDAPDGQPTAGTQIRFVNVGGGGATNFAFGLCSFKGGGGIWAKDGATEIAVDLCMFHGNRGLARLEAAFTGVLKWGLTNTYGNCPKVISAARGNQVINGDPTVKVVKLDGTVLGIRNADGTYTTGYLVNPDGSRQKNSDGSLKEPVAF